MRPEAKAQKGAGKATEQAPGDEATELTVAEGATVAGPGHPMDPRSSGQAKGGAADVAEDATMAEPAAGGLARSARVTLDLQDLGALMVTVPPPASGDWDDSDVSGVEAEALGDAEREAKQVGLAAPAVSGDGDDQTVAEPKGTPPTATARAAADRAIKATLAGGHQVKDKEVAGAFGRSQRVKGFKLAPGTQVGSYELIRRLGKGGMGEVWAAYDTRLGRQVAIKFLLSKAARKKEFRERFIAEARATAQFNHENIVTIHDVGEHSGMSFLVLEYLEGEPLSARLKDKKLSWMQSVQMMIPVVRALKIAHEASIIHRDLKPANIFVLRSGGIKVLDFGLAKLFDTGSLPTEAQAQINEAELAAKVAARAGSTTESQSGTGTSQSSVTSSTRTFGSTSGRRRLHDSENDLTEAGAIMGTYAFMSPEQWGLDTVDPSTDLWAVGVILFMAITGEHPFGSKSPQVILKHLMARDEPVRSVRELVPEVPESVARIVGRCLRKNKEVRFATADELLERLEDVTAKATGRATLREDQSPYQGLAPFTERDANRFFGRDAEIAQFISKLKDWPTLAVIGPSGAGKSSFVRAGVIPTLLGGGDDWDVIVCRPGRDPFAAVSEGIHGAAGERTELLDPKAATEVAKQEAALAKQLAAEPGHLGATLRTRARAHGRPVLLYLDQFEELYTLVEDVEVRERFATAVANVAMDASTPVRVVLSMRSDFLDRVSENAALLQAVTRELTILQQPSAEGLHDAIIQPAALAGYAFEDAGMVEEMVNSLATETAALPLLQFAAAKLWEQRDKTGKMLTRAAYERMGGVEGALVRHADAVVEAMPSADRVASKALFQRLVTPEGTRAVLSRGELEGLFEERKAADRLLQTLTEARLLVIQTVGDDEGDARVEIVHESLITRWGKLQRWLEEGHEDAAMLAQLRDAARQWEHRGRPTGLLWTGDAVDEARLWRRRSLAALTSLEDDFLTAAFRFADRATRRRRALVIAGVAIMALVTAGAIVAAFSIREASQRAQREAERAREEASRAAKEAKRASAAEQRVLRQMKLLAAETERAKKAESLASKRLRDFKASQARELEAKGDLAKSYEDLSKALKKAQKEEKRANRSAEKAQTAEKRARKAAQAERKSRRRLEVLLRREREENRRLRKMRTRIYQSLPVGKRPRTR